MNNLFFDIECAQCEKHCAAICEFGYVLTDDAFNILDRGHFMINPDHEYDEYALNHILHYTREEYDACPKFPEFYGRIAELISAEGQRIIGHTTGADFFYLECECERYGLPSLKTEYFDITEPYKFLHRETQATKLETMLVKLGVALPGEMHNAEVDALATMLVCRTLCYRYRKRPADLLVLRTRKPPKKKQYSGSYTCGQMTTTLGDQLRAKGIDLSRFFTDET